ncbi:MAG: hypothetical protein Q7U54_07805 [Bacteroidales bacterium]|nr:hypothetical protein [Bacteroidales bacterium]
MKFIQSFVFTLITFFCFISLKVNAQENVFVHLDKSVVVSGESIFFKAYLLNINTIIPNSESKILYIQITDPVNKKNLLFRSDIHKNGTCHGAIPIPDTLNTGYYLLSAYTNGMRNFNPEQAFTTRILVINQARNIPDELNSIAISEPSDSIFNNALVTNITFKSIDIIPNKKVYSTREKVSIDLKHLTDFQSMTQVSVSISRKSPFKVLRTTESDISSYLPYIGNKIKAEKDHSKYSPASDLCKYPIENKGFIFSGNLFDKISNKPLRNTTVLLSVPDSIANLKYAVTDSSGKFYFLLEQKYNNRELILQLKDSPVPVENTTIIVENKVFNPDYLILPKTILDSAGSDFVTSCQQLAMINKIYASKSKTDTLLTEIPLQNYSFYGKPDEIIKPSEFLEMPNLEDIVANIVRNARYKVTENQSTILVADKFSNQFREGHNAMVLLNNIPVFDYSLIRPLGSKQIQRIELKTKRMYYGDLEIFGIFSIFTKEDYLPFLKSGKKVFSFPNEVLSPVKSNISPDYSLEVKRNSKIPDFRTTLYWNPDFEVKNKIINTVEFYTSDLKTSYEIVIQGITADGIPVSARATFEVR